MFRRKKRTTLDSDMDPSFMAAKPVGDWTVGEVCHWLKYIGLDQYQDAFFFNEVDGDMLLEIDDDDLITLPVEKITHRRKILRRMEALKVGGAHTMSETESISEYSLSEVGSDVGSLCGHEDTTYVKCVYHEDVRKFPLGPRDTYEEFIKLVEEEWGAGKGVKYKDEEGDMVQVRETEELRGVYQMSRIRRVRLVVYSLKKKKRHHHHHRRGSGSSDGSEKSDHSSRSSRGSGGSLKRRSSCSSIGETGVLEHFVDPVVISNRRGMITFFNSSAEQLFGWERGDVIGKNVTVLMKPALAEKHPSYLRRYRKEGNSRIIGKGRQIQAMTKSGDVVNLWITLSETNTSFIATFRAFGDKHEEAAKESGKEKEKEKEKEDAESHITHNHRNLEKELKGLNEYPISVIVMDEKGIIQYTNPKANEELGYQPGGLLGKGMWVVCAAICSEDEADLLAEYKRARKQRKRAKKKEGKEGKGGKKGDKELNMGLLEEGKRRDVICSTANQHLKAFKCEFSDRKHLGKTLYVCSLKIQTDPSPSPPPSPFPSELSEEAQKVLSLQRGVTSTLIVPAFIVNGKGLLFEANSACCDVFASCFTEMIGQSLAKILPECGKNEWLHRFLASNGESKRDPENKVMGLRDGKEISLNLFLNKVQDEERGLEETFFTGILQDLSRDDEEEENDDALVESSAILKQQIEVISNLAIPACVITSDSKIRAFNTGCEDLFGFSLEEVLNKDVVVLMPQGELRAKHPAFVTNYAAGKKKERDSVVVGKGRRVVGRHKEGHNITTFLSVTERKDGHLCFYTGVFTV